MKNKLFRSIVAAALALAMTLGACPSQMSRVEAESVVSTDSQMRAVWVSYMDYASLGMANVGKAKYKANVKRFLNNMKGSGINTIFLQVRSYDDAIWESDMFPGSYYLSKKARASVASEDTYTYDALKEFVTIADGMDLEVHAWLNPYRVTREHYLDPALASSRNRVLEAVDELMEYDIAGIHFDDYFYHAPKGYVKDTKRNAPYTVSLTSVDKCKQVNKLIKAVYNKVHEGDEEMVFGISPQANIPNDMNAGADVYTWLGKDGYIDYLVPQIYWTDNYGSGGKVRMYTDRLNEFAALKKNSAKLYVGLALYHAGTSVASDPGWTMKTNNLASQVTLAQSKGANGYILFSARFMTSPQTQAERTNLLKVTKN